ncbi:TetR/AcrR family transcriptional regulator [Brevibacillus sp. SYSU BS000544]|uniref:TetR/AcrR family transcriptional regulator n=1 Tax=Brevibacillus sp. SYSU BS000544 TaxID=3416443 RepID=UPI003CE4636B
MEKEVEFQHLCTYDKILHAALALMSEKGYSLVTTKEIAQHAGVSEMTLFRHFGTKKALFEKVVGRFSYGEHIHKLFDERLTYDLEADLLLISETYHRIMHNNKELFLLSFKEGQMLQELEAFFQRNPIMLKNLLIEYFKQMQRMGKMREIDPESTAMTYIWMNYGYFHSTTRCGKAISSIDVPAFVQQSVRIFLQGVQP